MMNNFSIIQKSQLEGALRLDAEYYQPGFLEMKNKLTTCKNVLSLFELANIKTGPAYSSEKISEDFEIPLARIGDVTNKTETDNWLRLSNDEFKKFNNSKIDDGDILMTMTGDPPDVGKVNFVNNKSNAVLAFNQRVAKLNSKSDKISGKYLFAYLSNEFSRFQIERAALGIRQRNLGINDLRNILVVIPNDARNVENSIDGYLRELENSKSLYQQAESLLLEKLGLKGFTNGEKLSSIVSLSEVKVSNRMDPDFFQVKYKKLLEALDGLNTKKIIEIAKRKKGILKTESKKEYKYIEIGDINVGNGEVSYNVILGRELPANAKMKISGGEFIISKVRPTRGAIAIVPDNWSENFIGSGAFSIFEVESPMREYLQVVLRSIIGKWQLEKPTTGTSYPTVTDEDVEKIKIPILPKEIQQKISDLVRQSHEARKKSKELLEEAKRKVEEMIEKGGERNNG